MAASKTKRTLIAGGTSNSAGGTTSGTELDLSTKYGGGLTVRITNGATGPTVAATAIVYVGSATGEKRELTRGTANTGNSVVTDLVFDIPIWAMFLNLDITGNTGQAVTCEAIVQELTSL